MNVSAVNCTPIKPQASFGRNDFENDYSNAKTKVADFQQNLVDSDDIKSPAGIALSVAASVAGIYAVGKFAGGSIASMFKSAPVKFESTLKKGSEFVQKKAQTLTTDMNPGKLNKAKNFAGKAISKTEELARKGYKKIAYSGIADDIVNPERANKAFKNAAGAATVAAVVPQIIRKDSNDDGVKDIMQKSQNAYIGAQSKVNNLSALGELISVLS